MEDEKPMKTTTDLTQEYIKEHPHIKSCLKYGLINYSALSRKISKDLNIEKKSSKEAILIAARRFKESLKKDLQQEMDIRKLLADVELELKNKIGVYILEKNINFEFIEEIHKNVRIDGASFYILEGSNNYTIITQEKYSSSIEKYFKSKIIKQEKNLALISVKSSKEIETTKGVVAFLTSLFSENGVNILEFLSCWTDTLFVIESKDVAKALGFLKF
jgi:hypothetical protein